MRPNREGEGITKLFKRKRWGPTERGPGDLNTHILFAENPVGGFLEGRQGYLGWQNVASKAKAWRINLFVVTFSKHAYHRG